MPATADDRARWAKQDRLRNLANDEQLAALPPVLDIAFNSPTTWKSGWRLKLDRTTASPDRRRVPSHRAHLPAHYSAAELDMIFATIHYRHLAPLADAIYEAALEANPKQSWTRPLGHDDHTSADIARRWADFEAYLASIGGGASGRPTVLIRRDIPDYHGFHVENGVLDLSWST
jgi:hypothetical protein